MTAGELRRELARFPDGAPVSLCYWNGHAVEVAEVERVADNGGPSLYAQGWQGPANVGTQAPSRN